jgi:hypothetical protein
MVRSHGFDGEVKSEEGIASTVSKETATFIQYLTTILLSRDLQPQPPFYGTWLVSVPYRTTAKVLRKILRASDIIPFRHSDQAEDAPLPV